MQTQPFPELRTPRLLLHEWTADDQAPFAALNADPETGACAPAACAVPLVEAGRMSRTITPKPTPEALLRERISGRLLRSIGMAMTCSALAGSALAAGGTYDLPWPAEGQVLSYRACGCADACWKAELRSRRTKAVLATLRCDCERLFVSTRAHAPERALPQACADLADKPAFIRSTLEEWLAKDRK